MKIRKLGTTGLEVSALGLGCMGMSEFYGSSNEKQSLETLSHALDIGVNFWDTSDIYGPHTNEILLGKSLKGRRDSVVLATKFGIIRNPSGEFVGIDSSPGYVRKACEASLRRLQTDTIDLYYQHRVDPRTPIEETVGELSRLVEEGKVRYIGLSEASAATLRRACAVHPVSALQSEYSLWSRDIEDEIIPACRELGVGLVAYSPLGRGFLSGQIRSIDDLEKDDWRRMNPRFQGENFDRNLELVRKVEEIAAGKNCSPSQLALAWLLSRGEDVVPIPGTRSRTRLDENAASAEITLSDDELAAIEAFIPADAAAGTRYPEASMALINA